MRVSTEASRIVVGLAILTFSGVAFAEREVVDRIAAVIEDEIITVRELEDKAKEYLPQLEEIEDPQERRERKRSILVKVLDLEIRERMIDKEIESNSEKLSVSDQDVDRAIDEVQKMNNLTREQLQSALYSQGMSWSEYRKKLRKQIERSRLVQFQVQGKVEVNEETVKRRCLERKRKGVVGSNQRVCASHILLKVPNGTTEAAAEQVRARAVEIKERIDAGESFEELATRFSDDTGAKEGDLGCFARGEMLQAFEEAAFSQDIGLISEPVRTQFGFHLIRVRSREVSDEGCQTPQELTPIQNELYQEELERQMNAWVDELRQKSFVEVRL